MNERKPFTVADLNRCISETKALIAQTSCLADEGLKMLEEALDERDYYRDFALSHGCTVWGSK